MEGLPTNEITRDSWIYQFPGPAIKKQFDGNMELAESHLGAGMALLFNVKSIMRNGLLGSFGMNHVLEDGTEIRVSSAFGNDFIHINSPLMEEEVSELVKDFVFKITWDDGGENPENDTVMTDDPEQNTEIYFTVIEKIDEENNYYYGGDYPTQDWDNLIVTYDEDSKIWTLKKRAELEDGNPDTTDMKGTTFDNNQTYWVRYYFSGNGGKWANETQYQGLDDYEDWFKEEDMIPPDYYEDRLAVQETYVFKFNFLDRLGNPITAGITCQFKDENGVKTTPGSFYYNSEGEYWQFSLDKADALNEEGEFKYTVAFDANSYSINDIVHIDVTCPDNDGQYLIWYYKTVYPKTGTLPVPPSGVNEVTLNYFVAAKSFLGNRGSSFGPFHVKVLANMPNTIYFYAHPEAVERRARQGYCDASHSGTHHLNDCTEYFNIPTSEVTYEAAGDSVHSLSFTQADPTSPNFPCYVDPLDTVINPGVTADYIFTLNNNNFADITPKEDDF